ncbi:single-stranded DNA-binding protein [Beijerinckia mobilis]|uniref:single-stranded DNA-binding protein n=1 Tax=Beijerinckia mobilis TaxID=231434 RepID=UPI000555A9A6|nr:single-stranded DNA-binding protein [Beijerinckia mobilis]
MSTVVLVQGTLFRAPERKTSKAGNVFAVATLKERDGQDTRWWKVFAFSNHLQEEILRLSDGDALTVQGSLRADAYDNGDGVRVSLSVTADHVLALKQPKPKRERKQAETEKPPPLRYGDPRPFDDDVDF